MMRVILWGGTGQARVLHDALQKTAEVVAVFDLRDIPSPLVGIPLYVAEAGFESWLGRANDGMPVAACVAIGGSRGRERVERQRWLHARGLAPLVVVHRQSFQASSAIIGEGCQLLAMSAVCAGVRLGDAVIVNTGASVDHDSIVGDGVHIAPGARVAGEVVIGDHAFIGTGAVILPRIEIGAGAIVGAGAVVTRNVAPGNTVIGNPARRYPQENP